MDRLRALGTVVAWGAGLVSLVLLSALVARWLLLRFAVSSPWAERGVLWVFVPVCAIAVFLLFAHASWAWDFWWRGWRVRWVVAQRYAYEEFDKRGLLRSFEIHYERLDDRYAPPCRITVPSAANWNRLTPEWAHGRRDAIVERVRAWGSHRGWNAPVTFVETELPIEPRA